MSSITFDSELLRQPLAQKTLAAALEFKALYDANSEVFLLSVNKEGDLLLLTRDQASRFKVVNLSSQLGVPVSERVTALTATQAINLETYLTFSTKSASGTSNLWVLAPFLPTGGAWFESLKPGSLLSAAKPPSVNIEKLLLGNTPDESGYPFLAAVITEPTRVTKDVRRVEIGLPTRSWKWATDLGFPFNINNMIDYCVGTLPGAAGKKAHGIFGIDETQQKRHLTFAGVSGLATGLRAPMMVNLAIVPNPQSVTTTLDEDGFTNVLLAGDGILHIASQNCTDSVPPGHVEHATFGHETLNGMSKIQISQTGRNIAIWGINGDNNLVDQSAVLKFNEQEGYDEMSGDALPVPVLPQDDKLQSFDAVFDKKTNAQHLYCLKGDGSVSSVSQAGDSKLWSEQQLQVPDPEDVQDVNAYSCHISVKASTGQSLPGTEVQLSASSQVTCFINQIWRTLSLSPTNVKTDSQGAISIMIPASDFAVPSITVTATGETPQTFNAATKAIAKLGTAAKAGSLDNVKDEAGKSIFGGFDEHSTKAIAGIVDVFLDGPQPTAMAKQSLESAEDHGFLWQFWHGIVSGVEKILEWVYDAGVFIITTAKKVWKFVVETAEQALKAISGLIKLLGDAVEEALTWLAEKLDWDGILDTAAVFNEMFNAGIGMVEEMIEYGADAADGLFADLEAGVAKWHVPPKVPEKFTLLKPNTNGKKNNHGDSPGFNWMNDQLEGSDTQSRLHDASSGTEATSLTDLLNTIFDDCLKPLWDNFKDTLKDIWNDLRKIFDSDSTMSWQDVMKNIGADIVLGIVRGIRKAVRGIMAVSHSFVSWIQGMLNKEIDIWLVSKLYNKITHGEKLTILNLCSLILAIPTNWVFRLLYGKRLREFPALAGLLEELRPQRSISSQQSRQVVSNSAISAFKMTPMSNLTMLQSFSMDNTATEMSDTPLENRAHLPRNSFNSQAKTDSDQKPIAGLDATSLTSKPAISRLRYVWRLGMLVKSAGVVIYTVYDTITTGIAWPTVGYEDSGAIANEFHKSKMMYVAIVMGVGSFPFEKMDRHPLGFSIRVFSWGCTGIMNVFKSVAAGPVKPAMAGLAGVWDLRMLADAWAIGSAYNAITKAAEPWGLGATVLVGIVMNGEGMVLAGHQLDYFVENGTNEDYYPPSWSTSLSGSLS